MYSQFRSQYPTASLTSDLLVAEPSHYVVQAVVKLGGSELATGLSAASTVEVAEDQARARALMILGISVGRFTPEVQALDDPAHDLPPGAPAQLNPASQPIAEPMVPADEPVEWDWSQSAELAEQELLDPYPTEESFDPIPPGLDEELPRPTKGRKKAEPKSPKRGRAKPRNSAPPEPIDLSDIIAQTDIELKRLGWDHTQGRKFLEQTYNKRSRQQLTDSELLEFLEYLKVQSANQEPPF